MTDAKGATKMTAGVWQELVNKSGNELSDQDRRIAELLAAGQTQAQVGAQLGLHRSAVWRRVRAIRARQATR